jgi:hypothetical protein
MSHCVALVRTDVSEECITSMIGVRRIGELGKNISSNGNGNTLQINVSTLMTEEIYTHETSTFTRATRHHIPGDGILLDNRYIR